MKDVSGGSSQLSPEQFRSDPPTNLIKEWIPTGSTIFSFHNATAVKGIWVVSATADGLVPLFTVPLSIVVTNSSSEAVLSANQSQPVLFIQH